MTHEKEWCYGPAWSEDGARILFFSGGGVYSVSIAGGQPQLLLACMSRGAIAPGGKAIAGFVRDANDRAQLAVSSPAGAPLRTYTHEALATVALNELSSSVAFSPDGATLGLISDEA